MGIEDLYWNTPVKKSPSPNRHKYVDPEYQTTGRYFFDKNAKKMKKKGEEEIETTYNSKGYRSVDKVYFSTILVLKLI